MFHNVTFSSYWKDFLSPLSPLLPPLITSPASKIVCSVVMIDVRFERLIEMSLLHVMMDLLCGEMMVRTLCFSSGCATLVSAHRLQSYNFQYAAAVS